MDPRLSSNITTSFQEVTPWLIDAAIRMQVMQDRWQHLSRSCLPRLLQNTVNILDNMKLMMNANALVKEKAYILLVYLCVDALDKRQATYWSANKTGVDEQLLSAAIVKVSEACFSFRTVSRLATSQIIPLLEKPVNYDANAAPGGDLWVSHKYDSLKRVLIAKLA
jgi:hypothetical protein